MPGLHALSVYDKSSCFERKGTLEKHDILSGTRFAYYFKFWPTKTVLTEKSHVQSKVENIPSHVLNVS